MNRIYFFFIFILFCKSPKLILKEPATQNAGAVAFGVVIYDSEEKNLFDESNSLKSPIAARTNFFEIKDNGLDLKNSIQVDFTTDEDSIQIGNKDYIEKTSISFKLSPVTYFILSNLDSENQKVLGTTSFKFTTLRIMAHGKRANQTNYEDVYLDLDNSRDILNLKIASAQFKFLGIYLIDLKLVREGKFFDIGEKKIGKLKNANEKFKEIAKKELSEKIYLNGEINDSSAEKLFLEVFLRDYPENYWRKLALKRLLEIKK